LVTESARCLKAAETGRAVSVTDSINRGMRTHKGGTPSIGRPRYKNLKLKKESKYEG
jgi:hypothetical protein